MAVAPDFGVKRIAERKRLAARRAENMRRSPTGQVIETYYPDTLAGDLYDTLGRAAGGVSSLFGGSEDSALRTRLATEQKVRDLAEFFVGPEELERTGKRIVGGQGGVGDYLTAALTAVPLLPKPVKGAIKKLAVRGGKKIADVAGMAVPDAVKRWGRTQLGPMGPDMDPGLIEGSFSVRPGDPAPLSVRPQLSNTRQPRAALPAPPMELTAANNIGPLALPQPGPGLPPLASKPLAARTAPRARQKPQVRTDNPGGDWLKYERQRADDRLGRGHTKVSGAVTGYLKKPIELDPQKLSVIPGARGERRVPGDPQYDNLRPLVEREGLYPDSPILVGINHRGEPYIIEGNTRTAVARDLGLRSVPAEVRYFAGGEGVEGPMMPSLLEKYMAPSELSQDTNFRRFFEGSQAVDAYGEPLRLYHGTSDDIGTNFNIFHPNRKDAGWMGRGAYISDDPLLADSYARMKPGNAGPNILSVYANIKNPYKMTLDEKNMLRFWPQDKIDDWTNARRASGHDATSLVFPGGEREFAVFDPERQLKSATGNRGTYDPGDPDLRKARGGRVSADRCFSRHPLSAKG